MKPILNFIDTWGIRIMFFLVVITFFKTCSTNSKVQDVNDSVDSLSVKLRKEIKIEGLPAGTTAGTLNYVDISKTHADNEMPLIINLAQGPDLPTQTPTPKPTIIKKPTDGCAKQIKH